MISLATTDDIPALSELLSILFTQEAEFVANPSAQSAGLKAIIENPSVGRILKFEIEGEIIGMVNLLYTVSTALGARVAILEDMVVNPSQRSHGLGGLLLDAAIQQASQDGCRRMTLLTDCDNTKAMRFYERRGFIRSPMVPMRLLLNSSSRMNSAFSNHDEPSPSQ
ncbi:GCN5-related N-acetyltransferase [Planctopirus limnophila DSM 3776]|uniref:GCN5-related N-acetyltransferase n=1 Tax=Planctopirus limnophila (strain ATCC 43296 / DSM 3776 / IFAM 1008 / Mu 290) TaxID=521674 RepID=D5SW12_PLAL2|nr:GCN5-related N-acetyltransferase [Planctopirus limnophila DSM 3776]